MGVPTLDGMTTLGSVGVEKITLDNNLIVIPRPAGSSDNTLVSNLLGKTRRISVAGYFEGSLAQLQAFIAEVEAIANTNLQVSRTYTDRYGNTHTVLIDVFNYDSDNDNPNRVTYYSDMIEGSLTAWFTGGA